MNLSKPVSMAWLACIMLSGCSTAAPTVATKEPLPAPLLTAVIETPSPAPIVQADTGWQGEYFNNDQFQGPAAFTQADSELSFDWANGSPESAIPADHFSARWTRCLEMEERYYVFSAHADDDLRLLVDDILVLQASWTGDVERPFAVSAGQHCIKVEYRELEGSASAAVSFRTGASFNIADASVAWKGEYFNNPNFIEPVTYTRNDPEPVFDWRDGNPAPGIPVDNFSVRWTRCLDTEGRDYVFTGRADDLVRVFVDEVQVLEAPGYADVERSFAMTAGSHCIRVEYLEGGGAAFVNFSLK